MMAFSEVSIPISMGSHVIEDHYFPDESTEILFGAHREIRKRLEVVCSPRLVVGQSATLSVRVVSEGDQKAERAEFTILGRSGRDSYDIQVFLSVRGFLIGEELTVASLKVSRGGEQPRIDWELTPERSGPLRMVMTFFCHGTYVGRVAVDTEATDGGEPGPDQILDKVIAIRPAGTAPDLYLLVERFPDGDETELVYHLYSPIDALTCHYQEAGSIRYEETGTPESWRERLLQPSPEGEDLDERIRRYSKIGRDLYDAFFPPPLKRAYWELRERVGSIQIVSGETSVPWEAIKPYRTDPPFEDPHLGERYAVGRWFSGPAPYCEFPLAEGCFLPLSIGMEGDSGDSEESADKRFLTGFTLVQYDLLKGNSEVFRQWLEDVNGLRSLHICCRGNFGETGLATLPVEVGAPIDPGSMRRDPSLPSYSRPLVFLNPCCVDGDSPRPLDPGLWARFFIESGAAVFASALWSVEEELAHEFARAFYMGLLNRQPLGQAVRMARVAVKILGLRKGSPAWLAYTVYGDPLAVANPARLR